MRKILIGVAAALVLGAGALAGPFLGRSFALSENALRSYYTLGWDSGSGFLGGFGFTNAFQTDGSFFVSANSLLPLTFSWRLGAGLSLWWDVTDGQPTNARWAFGITGLFKQHWIILQVSLYLPLEELSLNRRLLGGWVVFSFKYDLCPRCFSPFPVYSESKEYVERPR